ncbi:MAG: glycosyltransferase, exosortase A system-associated [Alphaproteobacteria bacterium]|nr:glycosyltransferase, exosortase A system-associated [Alphaproteobacteria bacterium]MBV9375773.1 glycosyltransferase, exosortase A system-associated [Alphaproteobacteria bacterium]
MRILHILDHSLPLHSGYVYRTLAIVNQQRALGWEPVLLTSGKHYAPGPAREQIGEWEFLRTPTPIGPVAKLPWLRELKIIEDLNRRLDEVIAEFRPEILHAHSPVLNVLPALRAGRRHAIPVVYEIRALWEDAAVNHGTHGKATLRYAATRFIETRALHQADAVTTICEGLRSDAIARGVSGNKITVIPNAVDRSLFSGPGVPDHALATRLGLCGKTVLAFFGSFYSYEGLHLLLRAVPEIRRHQPAIAVLLAGGGPEEDNLRALTRELDLDESVVFAGRIPHDEMRRYYDLADLFVFPRLSTRLTELVTPLKPLEAMAQERIVVASSVGGHRELIRDKETGYLFPPDAPRHLTEGVLTALADRGFWPRIRAQALEFIDSERSWAQSVERYGAVYQRVLKN